MQWNGVEGANATAETLVVANLPGDKEWTAKEKATVTLFFELAKQTQLTIGRW